MYTLEHFVKVGLLALSVLLTCCPGDAKEASVLRQELWLEKAVQLSPDDYGPFYEPQDRNHAAQYKDAFLAAVKKFAAKQYKEAAADFREIIKTNPNEFGAHYNIGLCMELMRHWDQAIPAYMESARLCTKMPEPYKHLARCHLERAKSDLQCANANWFQYKRY